jgi:shikimate kinase
LTRAKTKSVKAVPSPPIVALTGFMAAGKSTVGRTLGTLLRWRFVDLDCEIEQRARQHVHEIFALHGEMRFRQIESDTLHSTLEHASVPTVIALGGGTFVQGSNATILHRHGAHIVFLELAIDELLQRCRAASERPTGNPRPLAADAEAFCTLYAQRLPSYRQAHMTISAGGKTVDQIAEEIAAALRLAVSGHRGR